MFYIYIYIYIYIYVLYIYIYIYTWAWDISPLVPGKTKPSTGPTKTKSPNEKPGYPVEAVYNGATICYPGSIPIRLAYLSRPKRIGEDFVTLRSHGLQAKAGAQRRQRSSGMAGDRPTVWE